MLTLDRFSGINNVLPTESLTPAPKTNITPLAEATNVDIDTVGKLSRRLGYSAASAVCHKNVHQADGFMLATSAGGNLVNAGTAAVLSASLGVARVWYTNLPDGRTTFSNGLIQGIAGAAAATGWGVPIPATLGTAADVSGALFPGEYRWRLTYVRTSDGLEGGPAYSAPLTVASGGITLSGLPVLAGHSINVYLTSHNDGGPGFLAGNTTGSMFAFIGANALLQQACKTHLLSPPPVGTLSAFWRGRALLAVGSVLHASLPHQWELFDLARDVKQFTAPITLVQPVDGGIFVGTETELAFLSGTEFDKLGYTRAIAGRTVLGSGVTVPGELLPGDSSSTGMVCICAGVLVAGYASGAVARVTEGRYTTAVTEVAATFRMQGRTPQYVAIPQ